MDSTSSSIDAHTNAVTIEHITARFVSKVLALEPNPCPPADGIPSRSLSGSIGDRGEILGPYPLPKRGLPFECEYLATTLNVGHICITFTCLLFTYLPPIYSQILLFKEDTPKQQFLENSTIRRTVTYEVKQKLVLPYQHLTVRQ